MITITNRVVGSGRFVDFYRAFGDDDIIELWEVA